MQRGPPWCIYAALVGLEPVVGFSVLPFQLSYGPARRLVRPACSGYGPTRTLFVFDSSRPRASISARGGSVRVHTPRRGAPRSAPRRLRTWRSASRALRLRRPSSLSFPVVALRVGRGPGPRPAFPNLHPLGRHAPGRQSATVLAMLKRDLVVSTLVASLLGITAVVAACGAPPSSESSESSASAIGGINRCFFIRLCAPRRGIPSATLTPAQAPVQRLTHHANRPGPHAAWMTFPRARRQRRVSRPPRSPDRWLLGTVSQTDASGGRATRAAGQVNPSRQREHELAAGYAATIRSGSVLRRLLRGDLRRQLLSASDTGSSR